MSEEQKEIDVKREFINLLKQQNKIQQEGLALMRELYTLRKTLNYFLEKGTIDTTLCRTLYHFHQWQIDQQFRERLEEAKNK